MARTGEGIRRKRGFPVDTLDLEYEWLEGEWERLFDAQIALVQSDLRRARAEDRLTVYLSCPIGARGGGYHGTNVDVARFIERRLLAQWGEGVWILNPVNYQMQSKGGTGYMHRHAKALGIDLDALLARTGPPDGGDYMRMWTRVLAENGEVVGRRVLPGELVNTGQYFDAFYFIGPSDVRGMFQTQGGTLTEGIHEYFTRKAMHDLDFCDAFSIRGLDFGRSATGFAEQESKERDRWQLLRNDFFRYYALRASANFSLGSHDEWLILQKLNAIRRKQWSTFEGREVGGIGDQIAAFFDGTQVDIAASEVTVSKGNAL